MRKNNEKIINPETLDITLRETMKIVKNALKGRFIIKDESINDKEGFGILELPHKQINFKITVKDKESING